MALVYPVILHCLPPIRMYVPLCADSNAFALAVTVTPVPDVAAGVKVIAESAYL